MPRVRSQLALQLPPELIARIKAEADARGQTLTAMVRSWLEAALQHPPSPAAGPELEPRLAAIEARLAALEQPPTRSPRPATAAALLPPPTDGAITTAELAQRTGTNREAWNNWASADRIGQVRSHAQAGPWRLVGKVAPAAGGPPRWTWEPA